MTDTTTCSPNLASENNGQATVINLVRIENNQAVTSSREVAEHFGKQHGHVLRAIATLIDQNPKLDCDYFYEISYNAGTGKSYKEYLMNRKGFSLLVMGFTGKEALDWKIRYIEEFDRMEEYIRSQQKVVLSPLEILEQQVAVMRDHERRLAMLEGQNTKTDERLTALEEKISEKKVPYPNSRRAALIRDMAYRLVELYEPETVTRIGESPSKKIARMVSQLYNVLKDHFANVHNVDLTKELDDAQKYYRSVYYRDKASKVKTYGDWTPSKIDKLTINALLSTNNDWTDKAIQQLRIWIAEKQEEDNSENND